MTNTELQLRELLWMHHNCLGRKIGHLYGDDGEMQCHNCGGDFLRQSIETLAENIDNPNSANFFKEKDNCEINPVAGENDSKYLMVCEELVRLQKQVADMACCGNCKVECEPVAML